MASTIDNIKYFWKDLPNWAKGFVIVAGVGIPSYIGYTIYKNAKNAKQSAEDNKKLVTTKNDADNLVKQGVVAHYDETEYNAMADTLFAAMDGYGTDTQKIYSVMAEMKNDLDIHYLILAYGMRTLNSGTWNTVKDVSRSLAGALGDELGGTFGSTVTDIKVGKCTNLNPIKWYQEKDIVNCILETNGLKFRF